jgi:hypothetical protein
MDNHTEDFALTPEQQNTAALLERLFGRAFANRYVDFSRLAASATGLRASRPLAAHALRELDSMIRSALAVPMEAKAAESLQDIEKLGSALKALKVAGYGDDALQRARKALTPQHNHANEIRLIGGRLGLSAESDIVQAWISLTRTVGRAHERHFHRSMAIDDTFRNDFQQPFELVLVGLLSALQKRYAALMARVETIASMPDRAAAIYLFETEIPGAMPLQWHFYQTIKSSDWLPHLIRRELVREPAIDDDEFDVKEYGHWPIGHYLLNVAKSGDDGPVLHLVEAVRAVALSRHPAVRRYGLEIIAVLPPDVCNDLVEVVIGWLEPEAPNFYYTAPQAILKRLAEGGYVASAINVARVLFQVFERGGDIASLHPQYMYEHHLPGAVNALAPKDGVAAVRLFSDLLRRAAHISHKIRSDDDDYTYMTPHPLSGDQLATYGIWEALIIATRNAALLACGANPAATAEIVSYLDSRPLKIFRRLALHVLAKKAAAAPGVASALLTDKGLVGEAWCEDEYAELALAYFPRLSSADQNAIFSFIDTLPDHFRAGWRDNFTAANNRQPSADDERRYESAVLRDAMWRWRAVLPADRRRLVDKSVEELGDPDAWRNHLFPPEVSPLSAADFAARPVHDILVFLQKFVPAEEPVRQTISALGVQLRAAVEQEPSRYAERAHEFASLRPIYVRRLLEAFDSKVRNKESLYWNHILGLLRSIAERLKYPANTFAPADGDDGDWYWCCLAAAALLKSALRQPRAGLVITDAPRIEDFMVTLFAQAPHKPTAQDFESEFGKHPYFSAEQSLWGSAVELCVLFVWWHSKQPSSALATTPRSALQLLPQMAALLERGLSDHSTWGRIPRAVLGRHLRLMNYFGEAWLTDQIPLLFPADEELRRATWLAHLTNDAGPIQSPTVAPLLLPLYIDEIERMDGDLSDQNAEHRIERLGDYILVLWIAGEMPDATLNEFLARAPREIRRHVMGYLGRTLQLSIEDLPEDKRAKARTYWETRLAAALSAANKDGFREEIGAIGQWFIHDAVNIDSDWLFDQLLRMLKGGFAPSNGYSLIEWLGGISSSHPDRAVEVLAEMMASSRLEHWSYATHTAPIRSILQQGLQAAPVTAQLTRDVISVLATLGQSEYLDLIRSTGGAANA